MKTKGSSGHPRTLLPATKVALLALCCLMLALAARETTFALVTARQEALNRFIVGATDIKVEEDFNPPVKLLPGISFKKEPKVENTGNLPCFVRARADYSDSWMQERTQLNINTVDWEYRAADGYYYYKHLLVPGAKTSALFTTVTVLSSFSGTPLTEADMKNFDIYFYAEATQQGALGSGAYLAAWGI